MHVVEWALGGRTAATRERGLLRPEAAEALERLEHEFRTPLAAIRAIAEILRDEPDLTPAERTAMLEGLLIEQSRLARTLEALLDQLAAP